MCATVEFKARTETGARAAFALVLFAHASRRDKALWPQSERQEHLARKIYASYVL